MPNRTKNTTYRGIIVVLTILIVTLGALAFQNYRDYSNLRLAFDNEKQNLTKQLDKVIADYDLIVSENKEVIGILAEERNEMLVLRDSIRVLDEDNYNLFQYFRNKVDSLSQKNRLLAEKVDFLNNENHTLKVKTESIMDKLVVNRKSTLNLSERNAALQKNNLKLKENYEKLNSELRIAKQLKISDLSIASMKRKSSGRYTTTSRYRKVSAFKISLNLLKNEVAKEGERKVYIQVIDENRQVVSNNDNSIIVKGKQIFYSDAFTVNYKREGVNLVMLFEFAKGSLKKGNYLVNIFIEQRLVGNKLITLS